jgi:hypothetical protein
MDPKMTREQIVKTLTERLENLKEKVKSHISSTPDKVFTTEYRLIDRHNYLQALGPLAIEADALDVSIMEAAEDTKIVSKLRYLKHDIYELYRLLFKSLYNNINTAHKQAWLRK